MPWPVLSEVEVLRTSSAKNLSLWEQETLRYAQGERGRWAVRVERELCEQSKHERLSVKEESLF